MRRLADMIDQAGARSMETDALPRCGSRSPHHTRWKAGNECQRHWKKFERRIVVGSFHSSGIVPKMTILGAKVMLDRLKVQLYESIRDS